jgi:hypothetical protein
MNNDTQTFSPKNMKTTKFPILCVYSNGSSEKGFGSHFTAALSKNMNSVWFKDSANFNENTYSTQYNYGNNYGYGNYGNNYGYGNYGYDYGYDNYSDYFVDTTTSPKKWITYLSSLYDIVCEKVTRFETDKQQICSDAEYAKKLYEECIKINESFATKISHHNWI